MTQFFNVVYISPGIGDQYYFVGFNDRREPRWRNAMNFDCAVKLTSEEADAVIVELRKSNPNVGTYEKHRD